MSKTICPPEIIKTLEWQEMGPNNIGGRTRTLLIDKDDPNKLYSGGVSGGLFVSYDGGKNWNKHSSNSDINLNMASIMSVVQDAGGNILCRYGGRQHTSGNGHIQIRRWRRNFLFVGRN